MKKVGGLDYGTIELLCAGEDNFAGFRMLLGKDDGNSRLQDTGLFGCDFAKRVSEEILVIEIDAGNDGDDRLKNVSGIKAAAVAGFADAEFDALAGGGV